MQFIYQISLFYCFLLECNKLYLSQNYIIQNITSKTAGPTQTLYHKIWHPTLNGFPSRSSSRSIANSRTLLNLSKNNHQALFSPTFPCHWGYPKKQHWTLMKSTKRTDMWLQWLKCQHISIQAITSQSVFSRCCVLFIH